MNSPMDALPWPVTTARLSIRPATADDVEPTWRFRRLPVVTRWMTSATTDIEEYSARFLSPERLGKTLVIGRDGEVVGDLMLAVEDPWAQAEVADRAKGVQAEIGYCLDPVHGGQGLATEAVTELVRLCFEVLGIRRVTADCFADNEASWRLMERIGMRREVHARQDSLHRSGAWLDSFSYALLAEEWQSRNDTGRQPAPAAVDRDARHDWWGAVLDSPDAPRLARFYAELLGWELSSESDEHCTLAPRDGVAYLACQTAPDYVRPAWPNEAGAQQMMLHLDFEVTDLVGAVEHAVRLGAEVLDHQPQEGVRVLADPDGHPFCLYTS